MVLEERNRSVEHLVPAFQKRTKYANSVFNTVVCHRRINSIVGHAPLSVKFAVKTFLSELTLFPGMTDEAKMKTYIFATTSFMERYKIYDYFPWAIPTRFKSCVSKINQKKMRNELKEAYMKLLSDEEIKLGAYQNVF